MFTTILFNICLGLLGLAIFTVWSVREHLNEFSWKILFQKNTPYWSWSLTMLLLIAALVSISPEGALALKTMTGLDISEEPAAFISLGLVLGRASRDFQKVKRKNQLENNEN